ncbi:MAG: hypothetical protein K1W38_21955, partial [Lachnospiraceae bacterium]
RGYRKSQKNNGIFWLLSGTNFQLSRRIKKLEKILSTEQRFKNVERSAVEINDAVTKSNMKIEKGKESVDMCLAIQF